MNDNKNGIYTGSSMGGVSGFQAGRATGASGMCIMGLWAIEHLRFGYGA